MRPSSPARRSCYNRHAVSVCAVVAVVADARGFCPLDGTDLDKVGEVRRKNAQAQCGL